MATSDPQTKPSVSSSQTVTCSESSSVSSNNLTRTGTVFYSLDNNDSAGDNNNNNNNKKKRPQFETSENDEDTVESDHTVELKRKQSKIGHHTEEYTAPKKKTEPVTPSTPSPTTSQQQPGSSATELDIPDWHNNYKAWAFLQSQNPAYKSMYLVKRDNMEEGRRSGYVLGRKADCDIVFHRSEISKTHCIIYMETGAVGEKKGIRIYIDDRSFNGTYVNGTKMAKKERKMLRNDDEIQLFRKESYSEDDPRHKFFRVLLPPSFEADRCERLYALTKVLGRGNFASVFLARDKETGQEVAIKVLNKSRLIKPKQHKSIQTEIGVMMSLQKHPFIVNLFRVFHEENKIYLVLEYMPGGELFQYVVENQRLSEDDTRFIFFQLFTAVHYLHCNNIVHRDLKPENVLIANKDTLHVKITDFGLANTEQRDQAFGSQCGTPNYVAPEILDSAENRAYNKQCDLWSLGVMLYICLCGFPPFSEESAPPSMKMQIKQGLFTFPSPYWDDISKEAKDLITKLLKVDPVERFTATEALDHPWMRINDDLVHNRLNCIDPNITTELDQAILCSQSLTQKAGPTQPTPAELNFDHY